MSSSSRDRDRNDRGVIDQRGAEGAGLPGEFLTEGLISVPLFTDCFFNICRQSRLSVSREQLVLVAVEQLVSMKIDGREYSI